MQLTINRIDTRYVLDNEGGGPWLVFIHQLAGDLSVWDQMAGYFRHGFTVLRYDLRGHGESGVSPDSFTIDDLADDLAQLLDKLGAPSAHVVGLSIGGMVAQKLAINHADKVESLTVVGAPAFIPEDARPTFARRAASVRERGTASIVEATLERWLTPEFRKAHPEVVEQIGDTIARTPAEGFARAAAAVSRFDARDALPSVKKRTLVVAGQHDVGTPHAASKLVADAVPGARFELLNAAHLSPVEESQRFSALVAGFLRDST
ncbi:3-oxoadipate enol-lactonase [Caballeronia novacaledonica]|uniref:3-oxoadipate enol-lactonase n=1 Tax=Caballeronia novacaledonica TaxID=1544861 RepID=A0A2U3IB78_9BURK|nr:alpha/beta fold hydrolase [Caballeronia novacaledonica]SPB17469.1 3-oxoadipate enol-lactonase [Caballeronia novacaledonica]